MIRFAAKIRPIPLAAALLAAFVTPSALSQAQSAVQTVSINIPAQPAAEALKAFVEQTKFQLIYSSEVVAGVNANAVQGNFSPRDALTKLLSGTDVNIVFTAENAATLQKKSQVATLDMVVVSARKKDELSIDVPIAVTALGGEYLKRRGANSLADVLQDSPGVSSFDYGGGLTKVSIRGISTSLGGNENGYYLNDLPFTGVTVPLSPDVRAWDLDRIEVLRGPQGTLFGEGSMGGTVRILTNRPRIGQFSFAGQLAGSSTKGGGSNDGEKLMLNVPMGEMLAVRMAATHEKFSGWIDDASTGKQNLNASKIDTGRIEALFEPTDRLHIDASLWKYKATFDKNSNATDAGQIPPVSLSNDSSNLVRGISVNYDFDNASLFYGYSNSSFSMPLYGPYLGGVLDGTIGIHVRTHELRLGSTTKSALKWTAGLYRREAKRSDHIALAIYGIDNVSDTDISGSSVFGEVSYALPDLPLELTVGLRRFTDKVNTQDYNSGIAAAPVGGDFSSTNPRLSVAWHVEPLWQIYASAAKGFRSGQTQPSASVQFAKTLGLTFPPTIPADSIWSYELGTKRSLMDHRLMVEAAVYHSDWKNFAVRAPIGSTGINGLVPSPGTKTDGIEGSIRFEFTKNLSAGMNASYTRARYVGAVPGTGIAKGSSVDEVAPFVLGASVDYSFAAFAEWTGRLHAGYQHSSKREYPSFPAYLPGDQIDNLNARLGFEKGNWTVSLYGENLTNDGGAVSPRSVQGTASNATRLRPRTIGLELRYWMGK